LASTSSHWNVSCFGDDIEQQSSTYLITQSLTLSLTPYWLRGEHANHYTTDVVTFIEKTIPPIISYIDILMVIDLSCLSIFIIPSYNIIWVIIICGKKILHQHEIECHHIGGVMVSVLATSAIDREFDSRSDQTKDYVIGICCFFVKNTTLSDKVCQWLRQVGGFPWILPPINWPPPYNWNIVESEFEMYW
jgi:hypothetical protein